MCALHTKGPWSVQQDCRTSIWAGGHYIAETYTDGEKNARCIAVLPDVFAVLNALILAGSDEGEGVFWELSRAVEARAQAKAIIAKLEAA